jgi:hypothetical protein
MRNHVTDYLESAVRANESSTSPCQYDNVENYIDAFLDVAISRLGKPNAAQKATVEKWAREDFDNYYIWPAN